MTSAALILFLAFVALAASPGIAIKILATALAAGIVLDATIIRALIVPALITSSAAGTGNSDHGSRASCASRPHSHSRSSLRRPTSHGGSRSGSRPRGLEERQGDLPEALGGDGIEGVVADSVDAADLRHHLRLVAVLEVPPADAGEER